MSQKIEQLPISTVLSDPANLRRHDGRNIAAIKASLVEFGQVTPIVVDAKTICRKGNGTLIAARELGWQTIQAVRTTLEGSRATAYAIADNRTADLSSFDDVSLAETLRALQSEDLSAATGYLDGEIDALCEKLAKEIAGPLEFKGMAEGPTAEDEGGEVYEGDENTGVQASQVRMVQLFLTVSTFPDFQQMTDDLAEEYGTSNATDTVMECLRRATHRVDQQAA